jgi:hypothetical protein
MAMIFDRDDLDSLATLCTGIPKSYAVSLYKKQKLFHMHIPKTGGTFLKNYFAYFPFEYYHNLHLKCDASQPLYPDPTDSIPVKGVFQDQPGYNESLRFCVIRNPFDWLTSYYYHSTGNPHLLWDHVAGVGGIRSFYPTFESLVDAYCDEKKYWQKGLAQFRKFYPFQIFDEAGNSCAHFAFKNGSNNELNHCSLVTSMLLGINYEDARKPFDVLDSVKIRKSYDKRKDYKEYYTQEMVNKLSEKWKDILSVFGYDFYGSTDSSVIIDLENLKYCKKTNKLWSE